jgi:hypothetical protein
MLFAEIGRHFRPEARRRQDARKYTRTVGQTSRMNIVRIRMRTHPDKNLLTREWELANPRAIAPLRLARLLAISDWICSPVSPARNSPARVSS